MKEFSNEQNISKNEVCVNFNIADETEKKLCIKKRKANEDLKSRSDSVPASSLFGPNPVFSTRSTDYSKHECEEKYGLISRRFNTSLRRSQSRSREISQSRLRIRSKSKSSSEKDHNQSPEKDRIQILFWKNTELYLKRTQKKKLTINELEKRLSEIGFFLKKTESSQQSSKFVSMFSKRVPAEKMQSSVLDFFQIKTFDFLYLNQNSPITEIQEAIEVTSNEIQRIHTQVIPLLTSKDFMQVNLLIKT